MPSINWLKANLVIDLLVGDISHPILFIKLKSSVSHWHNSACEKADL